MAGSGKAITVNEDEIAKAATLLGTNKEDEHDHDEQADHLSSMSASATCGFAMAGSGKAITVNEDEIAKAATLLGTNKEDEHDYDEQADHLSSMSASATCGFAMAGSGKAITVNEDEIAKAATLLGTNKEDEHDYDEQADHLSSMPASTTGGFAMAGSGKAITVNEDEIAKAATLLGTNKEDEHDYDEQADHLSSMPASTTGGFAMAGSGKAITVNDDEIAKAATLLGSNKEDEHDYDEQAGHLSSMPASATGGVAMAGSGKAITVNEDEIAKAATLLGTNKEDEHDYDEQADHLSSMPASATGGVAM